MKNDGTIDELLKQKRLLPLVSVLDLNDVQPLEEILVETGLPIVEIVFRSKLAAQAIDQLRKSGQLLVGAGTVKNLEHAKAADNAGAQFIVTPGLSEPVVSYFLERKTPIYPGIVTPSEVSRANDLGLYTLKAFPIGSYGGIETLKALHGPFFETDFVPTGGVNEKNYLDYLNLDYVRAVGGTFILPPSLIQKKDWSALKQIVSSLMKLI